MTRFTVVWVNSAEDELADIWLAAVDQNSVAMAANAIDQELRVNPAEKGSDISEGLCGLIVPPLKVLFTVQEVDRTVEVLRVRLL